MRDNYVLIMGWMVTELGLKGNELIIYAIIYGFSQVEGQRFKGSLRYLMKWTNSSKQGVIKALNSLQAKGYIKKYIKYVKGIKYCEYSCIKLHEEIHSERIADIDLDKLVDTLDN